MTVRPFRFGVVAARAADGDGWRALARRVEDLGYTTLLMPDRPGHVLAPMPALAAAAAATHRLHVGTFVIANGLRNPSLLAWEAATIDLLSGGRFELGLGTGVSENDFRDAGIPFERPGARIDRLAETLRVVKAYFDAPDQAIGDGLPGAGATHYPRPVQRPRPPILVAGAGRRLLALAAREADVVALGVGARATEADLAERVGWIRQEAGERFASLELSLNLLAVVRDEMPPGLAERIRAMSGVDLEQLIQANSPLVVQGTVDEIRGQLLERRERYGFSHVTVPSDLMEAFAPVVQRLAGS
jgi:probable F420-dependent oxidoreductase